MGKKEPQSNFFSSERAKCSFDINDMSLAIWGSQQRIDRIQEIQKLAEEDPLLKYNPSLLGASREESFKIMAKRTKRIHELVGFNNTDDIDFILRSHIDNQPLCGLHWKMFIPAIKYLGTEKQVAKWLPLAESHAIFGTYAQTEIGHGSDVQSLETTATYDGTSEEFVLHSPTLTSTKWWPGELGFTSTHCIAHAQLIISGVNHGVQSFIVPIRDVETHIAFPGVVLGDLGPKLGYNTKDNGFMRLDNVRIPRANMLMRYAKVSKTGIFSKPKNEKIGYACMMEIRAELVFSSPLVMARVLTIGTRYSLFRTQFKDSNGTEKKILDYQLQQEKLIPLIAETYAMFAGGQKVVRLHHKNLDNIFSREDFSLFKDFHAIASGCKALYTSKMVESIEKVRLSCGGHGFSAYSRFSDIFAEYSPFPTYEGENTVLSLQTARYLVKGLNKALRGEKLPMFIEYLKCVPGLSEERFAAESPREILNLELIRKCMRYKAAHHVNRAAVKLMEGSSKGLSMKDSWDEYAGVNLVEASTAHIEFFTYVAFMEMIIETNNENVKDVLAKMCLLYGLSKIVSNPACYFENGFLNGENFKLLQNSREVLMKELRNEALGLVEAFCYSDGCLGALGRSDGQVYETLFDWAQNHNRLNQPKVQAEIQEELRKIRTVIPPQIPKL